MLSGAMPRRTPPLRWLGSLTLAALAQVVGCGSSHDPPSTGFDLPTAETLGGQILTSPRVQPIYFSGFPYGQEMDTFLQLMAGSAYWPEVVSEYGVGALTALAGYPTAVAVPADVTDTQLPDLLSQVFVEGAATLGPPRGDTVYVLFLSPATTLTAMGQVFCKDFGPGAYHDEWTVGGVLVAAAIVPACTASPFDDRLGGADVLTPSVSHEIVEAVTDPFGSSSPAYTGIDGAHVLWAMAVNGAELGDLCENEQPTLVSPSDIGFPVQRIWSNASAHAGTGPCVPVPEGEIYFNAVAAMPDHGNFQDPSGATFSVPVVNAKIGQASSARFSFRGSAAAPATLFAAAFELDDPQSLVVEVPTVVTGTLGRTLSVPVTTSQSTTTGVVPLVIAATDASRTAVHLWVGGINRN